MNEAREGYEEEKRHLTLTWEDIRSIDVIIELMKEDFIMGYRDSTLREEEQEWYEEALRRFHNQRKS